MDPTDRDELITGMAIVRDSVLRMERVLLGNGREGLMQTVARLDERSSGGRKERLMVGGGVSLAMIVTLFDQIKNVLQEVASHAPAG